MVCVVCKSSYEIKSKENVDIVNRSIQDGLFAGSYRMFCQHQKARESMPEECKHFLVIVSRSCISKANNVLYHPVKIAEIHSVVPRLSKDSFGQQLDRVPIRSYATVRRNSAKLWLCIPQQNKTWRDIKSSAQKVLKEEISDELFKECEAIYKSDSDAANYVFYHLSDPDESHSQPSCISEEKESRAYPVTTSFNTQVAEIRKELEGLRTLEDNWEDSMKS